MMTKMSDLGSRGMLFGVPEYFPRRKSAMARHANMQTVRYPDTRMNPQPNEKRLEELREQAWKDGVVVGPRGRRCGRTDSAQTRLLRPSGGETAGLDLGSSALLFLWRTRWDVGSDRARRDPLPPCRFFARDNDRSCAHGDVDCRYRRRSPFANSSHHGSWPSPSLPQHAARFQTSLRDVDGRVDSDRIWHVRSGGFDHARIARASDFSWHVGSASALRCWNLYFCFGDFRNFARDLHRCVDRRDRDSRVVLTSHIASDSFWNGRSGMRGRRAWNCWGTESPRSIFSDFTPPQLRPRF